MRRSVAGWVFIPVACLAALICTLYLRSDFGSIDSTALFHESSHASKADALLKTLHSDVKQIVHSDHALHAMAAASIPHSALPIIAAQHNSEVPFEAARMPVKDGSLGPRKNRPGVAQHFVQLARQWVARIEPLHHRLAPLQNELVFLDQSVALVKQRLSEAESQRDAVQAVIKSSRDSVEHAQRLLENAPAERIALQRKMAHVANQISATSAAFEADKVAAADAALKYSLAQQRANPTPEDELAKEIANGHAPSVAADASVSDSHNRDLNIINSAINSREAKHSQLDEYSDEPDDQPFSASWKPMK